MESIILNGLTSEQILNEKDILEYKNYEIKCLEEPNTTGIASNFVNGKKTWYIYEIDSFKIKTIIQDHFINFKEAVITAQNYIIGKQELQKRFDAILEEKRRKRLEEETKVNEMIENYIKDYKRRIKH